MTTPELTLALAQELHRLYPDEYHELNVKFNLHLVVSREANQFGGEDYTNIYLNGEIFTLDDATLWRLWMRFKKDIYNHYGKDSFPNTRFIGFVFNINPQSFAEKLLDTLRGM